MLFTLCEITHFLLPLSSTDRLVLLGNHRDAWAFGAADASSGTAALLEISKKLGEMKAKGKVKQGIWKIKVRLCRSLCT